VKPQTLLAPLLLFVLAGCAPETAPPGPDASPAGFLLGLWHGFIMLFTFVVSLFNDTVTVYAAHNSGNLYNLGYILGAMMFWGSGGGACKTSR